MKKLLGFILAAGMLLIAFHCGNVSVRADENDTVEAETGSCGEGIEWTFERETGMLVISGMHGVMEDYSPENPAPWDSFRDEITAIHLDNDITIGAYAFADCSNLEVINPGMMAWDECRYVSIGAHAFENCSSLHTIGLEKFSLIYSAGNAIGEYAFAECASLQNLTIMTYGEWIDSSMQTYHLGIGAHAFEGCTSLESIAFYEAVSSSGYQRGGLSSVDLGEAVFSGCSSLNAFTSSTGITVIPMRAFEGCVSLSELQLFASITAISDNAFSGCSALSAIRFSGSEDEWNAISISSGNEILGDVGVACNMVSGAEGTYSWTFTDGVLELSPFSGIENARVDYYFPVATNRIDPNAVKTIIINEGITSLGMSSFCDLGFVESLYIPASISNEYAYAFIPGYEIIDGDIVESGGFENVYYAGSEEEWSTLAIADCFIDSKVYFGWESKEEEKEGWVVEDNKTSYYEDGTAVTDWKQIDNIWYYFENDGTMVKGWKQLNSQWYYFDNSGAMSSGWRMIDGIWYYFGNTMTTGWKQIDGKWYYFGSNGAMVSGWKQINGKWYYFANTMTIGWKQVNGVWYYFSSDGAMRTNWVQIGQAWYYFGTDGAMAKNWKHINNIWYYFGADGAMKTNWKEISGVWYYFGTDGAMRTGWHYISNTWYYFKGNGSMAKNETLILNGTRYSFSSSGAWIH